MNIAITTSKSSFGVNDFKFILHEILGKSSLEVLT